MKNVKELKETIKSRMKRCWGECCALFFISAGTMTATLFLGYLVMKILVEMNIVEGLNSPAVIAAAVIIFAVWVITVPYKYGLRWYRLQQVRGHSVHAKSVFSCYFSSKRMLQVYKLSTMLFLKKSVLLIPFLLLIGAVIVLVIKFDANNSIAYNLAVVILLMLSVAAYMAYTVITMKYAAAPYLFAIGHDRPARDIIKESVSFMRGKESYMITVLRSCGLMLIPCILVFPMAFAQPKVMMLYTAAINEIIENGFAEDRLVDMERRG